MARGNLPWEIKEFRDRRCVCVLLQNFRQIKTSLDDASRNFTRYLGTRVTRFSLSLSRVRRDRKYSIPRVFRNRGERIDTLRPPPPISLLRYLIGLNCCGDAKFNFSKVVNGNSMTTRYVCRMCVRRIGIKKRKTDPSSNRKTAVIVRAEFVLARNRGGSCIIRGQNRRWRSSFRT